MYVTAGSGARKEDVVKKSLISLTAKNPPMHNPKAKWAEGERSLDTIRPVRIRAAGRVEYFADNDVLLFP